MDVHRRRRRVAAAGGVQPDAAAHAAEAGRDGREPSSPGSRRCGCSRIPFILVLWLVTFVDATVHNLFFNWTGTFLGTAAAAGRRRHSRQLDHAGDEHRPDRGDPDDAGPRRDAEEARLADDDDRRHPRPRRAVRGVRLPAADQAVVVLINVLHGICYAFFFATVYIFVDEFFPKDARASAQGLFNLMILGFGPLVANTSARSSSAKRSTRAGSWTSEGCSWFRCSPRWGPRLHWRCCSIRRTKSSRPQGFPRHRTDGLSSASRGPGSLDRNGRFGRQ